MKPTACIGCRLRRRRCDRAHPICNTCLELKIPEELCVYKELNSNKKTSSGKEVLVEASTEHNKLIKEKFRLKAQLEQKLAKKSISAGYRYDMGNSQIRYRHLQHQQQDLKLRGSSSTHIRSEVSAPSPKSNKSSSGQNFFNMNQIVVTQDSSITSKGSLGSISWGSLMSVDPNMKSLLSKMDQLIKTEKAQIQKQRDRIETPIKANPFVLRVRDRLMSDSLQITQDFEYDQLIEDLIRDIEANFPNEKLMRATMKQQARVCPLAFVGWNNIELNTVESKLDAVISFDDMGKPTIKINSFKNPDLISDLAFIVSFLIFPAFHKTQLNTIEENFNQFAFAEYAEVLTFIYNRLVPMNERTLHLFPKITLERLQTWVQLTYFYRYTPSGRSYSDDPLDNTLNARFIITMARIFGINTDVDVTFAEHNKTYRQCLKAFWVLMIYTDIMESMENGLPPKIYPSECRRYEDYTSSLIETLFVLNRVLYQYNTTDFGAIQNPEIFIHIIEHEFIADLKILLKTELEPVSDIIENMRRCNLDDIRCTLELLINSGSLTLRFNIYSLIQQLYYCCYKRLKTIDQYSRRLQRLGILSMKYSSLIVYLMREVFKTFDKMLGHPNGFECGVLECSMGIFPHVSLSMKRVFTCAGSRLFDGLSMEKASVISSFLKGRFISEKELLREIFLQKEFQVLFTLKDLDDIIIDDHEEKLLKKFSILNNHKYIIFSFGSIISEISNRYLKSQSNIKVAKFNTVFFYLLKLINFFLNSTFTSDGTPIDKENFFMGIKDLSDGNSKEEDFNFGQLFDEYINTSSEMFDFNSFFNISQGLDETNEIDQFLMRSSINS